VLAGEDLGELLSLGRRKVRAGALDVLGGVEQSLAGLHLL
jgi:hypothetical protein